MGDADLTGKPRSLFRRETKGLSTEPVAVRLERGRVQFFARQQGETNPIFTHLSVARAEGHPDVVAPPSFATVVETLANEERCRQGRQSLTAVIGCDFRYLLHGEQHYAYAGLMYAGDELSVSTEVLDFYDKRGGILEFAVLGSTILHAARGVIVRARRTLVHRLG